MIIQNKVKSMRDLIAEEVYKNLNKKLVLTSSLTRPYECNFDENGSYALGNTLEFKHAPKYEVRYDQNAKWNAPQRKGSITLNIATQDLQFNDNEFSLKDESFQKKIETVATKIAKDIESAAYKFLMANTYQMYNYHNFETPTDSIDAYNFLNDAKAHLFQVASITKNLSLIMSPSMNVSLFEPQKVNYKSGAGLPLDEIEFSPKISLEIPPTISLASPMKPVEIISFSCPEGASETRVILKNGLKSSVSKGTRVRIDGCFFLRQWDRCVSNSLFTFVVQEEATCDTQELILNPVVLDGPYAQVSSPPDKSLLGFYLKPGIKYDTGILVQEGAMFIISVPFDSNGKKASVSPSIKGSSGIRVTVSEANQSEFGRGIVNYNINVLYGFAMQNPTSAMQILIDPSFYTHKNVE
ncbi:MAG: hypothetical protein IT544_01460 [Rhodobacteraceae bacterium]|nr:hypothetical protein [Paracoccaceae bacterium]